MEAFLRSPVEDTKMKKYFSKYLLKTYVYRLITTNNNKCLAQCLALGVPCTGIFHTAVRHATNRY